MTDARHDGRRALVTGAATGIGRATASRLAADGAAVVVNYIGDPGPADELVEEIRGAGGHALSIAADVSNEDQVAAMFGQAADGLGGPVDLLVNNAGIEKPFPLVEMPLEEWNKVLAVNLTGAFLCAREAARGLIAADRPGAILTPINQDLQDDPEKRRAVEEEVPWGRLGRPEEIAAAISWLASADAEYVVGTTLFVDGGMTLYPKFV